MQKVFILVGKKALPATFDIHTSIFTEKVSICYLKYTTYHVVAEEKIYLPRCYFSMLVKVESC